MEIIFLFPFLASTFLCHKEKQICGSLGEVEPGGMI
jgi:hypothetical protein